MISTSVPSFGAEWIEKVARLASTIALVSGRPSPVPSLRLRLPVATCRNGFMACSSSERDMPIPVSRMRRTTLPLAS
ncbi:hypothetical protein D3C87_2148250 [compost metagenome]